MMRFVSHILKINDFLQKLIKFIILIYKVYLLKYSKVLKQNVR